MTYFSSTGKSWNVRKVRELTVTLQYGIEHTLIAVQADYWFAGHKTDERSVFMPHYITAVSLTVSE